MLRQISPCLWFDGVAEEAAEFYVSILPDSKIDQVRRLSVDMPGGAAGSVLSVEFTLAGRPFIALNGGPEFAFTPAFSLYVPCEDQGELDRIWDALVTGGKPIQSGWLEDRYGVTWQIVPRVLEELLFHPDPGRAGRVLEALFTMKKIDIAAVQAAYEGGRESRAAESRR